MGERFFFIFVLLLLNTYGGKYILLNQLINLVRDGCIRRTDTMILFFETLIAINIRKSLDIHPFLCRHW